VFESLPTGLVGSRERTTGYAAIAWRPASIASNVFNGYREAGIVYTGAEPPFRIEYFVKSALSAFVVFHHADLHICKVQEGKDSVGYQVCAPGPRGEG
jgi:hypothetical protein